MLNYLLSTVNEILYSYLIIIMLLAVGIYFTLRTRLVQVRCFVESIRVLGEKPLSGHGVSSFRSMMISTAAIVGTGNIAGVATAIAMGGPGSVFWMWLTAVIGGASAFIESTLAQIYKWKDRDRFRGGPAYYIQAGLGSRGFGILFAVLLILCFGYGFTPLQAFNMSSALEYYIPGYAESHAPLIMGVLLAVLTGIIIFGGVARIEVISAIIVPTMTILYIAASLVVCLKNVAVLPTVLGHIFQCAFDLDAVFGGFAGSCVMQGIRRGLYSNEAGMGASPNAAAAAEVSHPAKQGMVQMLAVFLDTLVLCTATAMFLLMSGIEPSGALRGMPYVQQAALRLFGEWGIHFVTLSIFLFAFTSLLGNYYYTEANLRFINDDRLVLQIFRATIVVAIFLGPQYGFDTAWDIADLLMGCMTVMHLVPLILLGGLAVRCLDDYIAKKKAGYGSPQFKASDIGLSNTEWWQ